VSIRQNRIEGSNPSRSATFAFVAIRHRPQKSLIPWSFGE